MYSPRSRKEDEDWVRRMAESHSPAHTPFDGDIAFALSVGAERADVMAVGAIAAELVAEAIVNAIRLRGI